MLIAVLSDIHDNIWNLSDALSKVRELGAGAMLFCGDFCAPFTLAQLGRDFAGPIHAVFGNNDGDPRLLVQVAQAAGSVTLYGQYAELKLGGRRIAVNHYPEIARQLAAGGGFDLVCYGHDHQAYLENLGGTTLANPGEVMGRFNRPTFGLYDCQSSQFTLQEVRHFPRLGGAS